MSCKCNECQNPFVLPKGDKGDKGEPGRDGDTGGNGDQGIPGSIGNTGNDGDKGDDGRGYDATSNTSIDILTTLATSTSATITIDKAYTIGARVRFSDTSSPAVNYFEGICTAYSPISGAMTVGSIDLHRGTGTIAAWDVNLAGERGSDVYDSGWKELNDHNGTFGVAPLTGWTNPSIRVIGKRVFINGSFMIPLAQDLNPTVLLTDTTDYQGGGRYTTETFTGTNGGFALNIAGSATSQTAIIPTDLAPSLDFHIFGKLLPGQRNIFDTLGADIICLDTVFNSVYIKSDGKLLIVSHKDLDDSIGNPIYNSPIHLMITVADSLANVPEYTNYKHQVGGFTVGDSGKIYPVNVDGEDESMWGGYYFMIDTSYPVDDSLTELQIKTAFDSI